MRNSGVTLAQIKQIKQKEQDPLNESLKEIFKQVKRKNSVNEMRLRNVQKIGNFKK